MADLRVSSAARAASDRLVRDLRIATNTPALRAVRRQYGRIWCAEPAAFIHAIALELSARKSYRWIGYELIRHHPAAWLALNHSQIALLASGLDGWGVVDAFGRTLSGPAWVSGMVSDALVARWVHSEDRWLRRTALVSTIALNTTRDGGRGDVKRTLSVCEPLVSDTDDMVVKALSWALRALAVHDAAATRDFLKAHERQLAARVKREVSNKLSTGLKNPRRR